MARIGRALALAAGYTFYGIPWALARTGVLVREGWRFAATAARIGWKDGKTYGAS